MDGQPQFVPTRLCLPGVIGLSKAEEQSRYVLWSLLGRWARVVPGRTQARKQDVDAEHSVCRLHVLCCDLQQE